MATSHSASLISVLATLILHLSLDCSASSHLSSSPTIASTQIKFWSKNVQNQMPNPILKKLSPLSLKDADFFTNLMISKNNKFTADAKFCSLAKLACKTIFDSSKTTENEYTSTSRNKYQINSVPSSDLITKAKENPFSFFRVSVLKQGNTVHLPNLQESIPDRAFLPLQIASKISLNSIDDISKIFPQSIFNGATKNTIATNLAYCNGEAIKGEIKSCPKSLEEMISFSKITLGANKLISLSSKSTKGSNSELMIKNIKQFKNDKNVVCHEVFLPFATYFCHSLTSTNLYAVDLVEPKTGALVNSLLAICHMDTSPWPANHVAFQILKFGPGQGEACHWFTQIDLAWIGAE